MMAKKKTHEEFVKEISVKNPNIEILSVYTNSRTKISCLCRVCNRKWDTLPTSLSRGYGCLSCGFEKTRKALLSNTKEFIRKLSFVDPNIVITSEYISTRDEISCRCKTCGNIFQKRPMLLLRGYGCPACAEKHARESQLLPEDEFLRRLKSVNPSIIPLEKYNGIHQKILCRCMVHECNWESRPGELLKGHGCPQCYSERIGNALRLSQEEFEDRLQKVNPNIVLVGEYVNASTHTECECKKCGYIWKPNLNNLIYGKLTGCPKCQSYSKGEDKIKNHLITNNIEFKIHKTFKDLVGVGEKPLSYDFYIPKLNLLVEYQGQQHEKPATFGSISFEEANGRFVIQQEHDKRKRDYALKHNINLLEIWYYDYDKVEQILNEKLHN